jgi:hypothetical protein
MSMLFSITYKQFLGQKIIVRSSRKISTIWFKSARFSAKKHPVRELRIMRVKIIDSSTLISQASAI